MKVISCNLNGIRAAAKKGFFDWIKTENPDILCIQETKAQTYQLEDKVFNPDGYFNYFHDAQKKGYSGVAIYCKKEPKKVTTGLGFECADNEGRYVQIDYDNISIASLYLPSGTSGDGRQDVKYDFLDKYLEILKKQLKHKREYIICGDWNIAHKEADLKNWKTNQKNSGFLPDERAWLDKLFYKVGFVDSFRHLHPNKEQYTWWSNRSNAWNNNVGWRIDYQIITPGLKDKVIESRVYRDEKFSDHAPLINRYDI